MKNQRYKRYKRLASVLLAGVLMGSMAFPQTLLAHEGQLTLYNESQTQTASGEETVYMNNCTGASRTENFDDNWKFYLGEPSGAQESEFDDSAWDSISLPHDYSISQKYSKSMEAESGYLPGGTGWYRKHFTVDKNLKGKEMRLDFGGVYMNATVYVNGKRLGTHPYGYTPFSFDITNNIKFGGENVIAVKVENKTPSSRYYSGSGIYRNVELTVTDPVHVELNGTRVTAPQLESQKGGSVDVSMVTDVVNSSDKEVSVTLTHKIFKEGENADNPLGTSTTESAVIGAGAGINIAGNVKVNSPELWSLENPNLYIVRTEVNVDGQTVDAYDTEYGFRYFNFDKNNGFTLNGEKVKLKGVCMHHDQGALGSVANKRATQRQVEILKEMGCNSIRVTHNPASDALIEACNEQGILLIEEAFDGWTKPKNGNSNDYSKWFNQPVGADNEILGAEADMTWAQFDLTAMIERGFNAPSIIMWSLGNEVWEGTDGGDDSFIETQKKLIKWAQKIDTTRPVTTGDNQLKNDASRAVTMANALTAAGGTVGLNYCGDGKYKSLHQNHSDWILYGSETASAVNSRGKYSGIKSASDLGGQQLTSYDKSSVGWGTTASSAWYDVIRNDFVSGEYVWTGFDYIGEPTPWNGTGSGAASTWPSPKNSYFGIVDTAGFPKDSYYFYQSQWNDKVNTLHILPAWNENVIYKDKDHGNKVPVVVYSNAAEVELFFKPANGGAEKSLGTKKFSSEETTAGYKYQIYKGTEDKSSKEHENLYLTWYVPYADGTIRAVAKDKAGQVINNTQGRSKVTTTGKAAKLKATADRTEIKADGQDLSYITVDVTDAKGNIVPDAENRVTFDVKGEGVLAGVDNGSSPDHDSYQADNRKAFSGKVLGIVQSTKKAGTVTVTVKADGVETDTVTITTKASSEGTPSEKRIASFLMSKNYYVKTGNMPQLPGALKVSYTDGTKSSAEVKWDAISEELINQTGSFQVKGKTQTGETVSVNVNMIDEVAALLNYSATTPAGVKPVLPDSRPAVMADGTVLLASFPVTWKKPEGSYSKAGTVKVPGTAEVFGKQIDVTATVRVQNETVTIGKNIAPLALTLKQSIPENLQSDTLEAIKDGRTVIDDNSGGPNPSAWSNWAYSKEGNTKADITFEYATQQRIGQMGIYFWKDNVSATYPDAGTTEIYVSDTGNDDTWVKVEAKETIGEENSRVKKYTYDFAPVTATFIKICVTNSTNKGSKGFTCTGITEVEINQATGSFDTNRTASLESLKVNDDMVPQSALAAGSYSTPAIIIAELKPVPAGNASVTVLLEYEGVVRLILESEDHAAQNTFEVHLGSGISEGDNDPTDDTRDFDRTKMTAKAGSVQSETGQEGPASNVLDNDLGTLWHTSWSTSVKPDKFWIEFELPETTKLDALRYCGRNDGPNGRVNEYRVEVSTDSSAWASVSANSNPWTTVSTGNWDDGGGWKLALFDNPVEAKYVKLTGISTYGDTGNDKFMSASEIRVRTARETTDITDAVLKVEPETVEVSILDTAHPAMLNSKNVEITLGNGTVLRYGIDYLLSYENNTAEGTATVTARGIQKYSGSITGKYTVKLREKQAMKTTITAVPVKTAYKVGEHFDPAGLAFKIHYDNASSEDVVYGANNAGEFTFLPSLDTPLTAENKIVTATYQGQTMEIQITTTDKEQEKPGNPEPVKPENPEPGKPENPKPGKPENPGPGKPENPKPGKPENPGSGKPENPKPGKPENPKPGKPSGEGHGGNAGSNGQNSSKGHQAAKTGDMTNPAAAAAAAVLAISGASAAIIYRKKRG